MPEKSRKRRWWIRIPVFLILVLCLAFVALVLEVVHPILSVGRGLSAFDGEQRAAALAVADLTATDSWLIQRDGFSIFAGSNGNGPIYRACLQRDEAYLDAIRHVAQEGGYDAGTDMCDPNGGLVIAAFHGMQPGYYAGRAYTPDNAELCPVFQYDSVEIGPVTLLWRTGEVIC